MAIARRNFLHGVLAFPAFAPLASRNRSALHVSVSDGSELAEALTGARPGDTILLAPGDYGGVDCFALTAPDVTLRATVPQRSILWAPMEVTGDRATLADLTFRSQPASGLLLAAVTACKDSLSITSSDVEVVNCDFGYFPARAILVRPKGGLRPYIHDCTFHDNVGGSEPGGNSHEAISLGYDNPTSNVAMRARVIANRLWNLNIEDEAICVKTSDNLIQENQISSSKGAYSNRYGERNHFINNKSINSRGFLVEDRSNHLIGNRIEGAGKILILGGGVSASVTTNGPHVQATSTYLEGNTGLLVIGHNYSGTYLPALDTQVKTHGGSIKLKNHTGTLLPGQA